MTPVQYKFPSGILGEWVIEALMRTLVLFHSGSSVLPRLHPRYTSKVHMFLSYGRSISAFVLIFTSVSMVIISVTVHDVVVFPLVPESYLDSFLVVES